MRAPALLLAGPAAAQNVPFAIDPSITCANAAQDSDSRRQYVGLSARHCIDQVDIMVERVSCLDQELACRDYVLTENMRRSKEKAAKDQGSGFSGFSGVTPAHFDALDRAWRTYSDALCTFELDKWGGGSGTAFGASSCQLKVAGEQALFRNDRWLTQ